MYKNSIKRLLDFLVAFFILLCIWWLLAIIAIWLHFANKGAGAFFFQDRPGKNKRIFKIVKFKTMTDERGKDGRLLPDDQRLTKVGKLVRSLSLDELPQLVNVLKGDMSFIGPRPLIPIYLELYDDYQARRMEVRPGITGLAQVNGRNHCPLSKKFELDVWYVDHCSFLLDIKIICQTVLCVIKRSDVGSGNADMKDIDDLGFLEKIKDIKNSK